MIAKIDGDTMDSRAQENSVPVYAISEVPVTVERKPWFNIDDSALRHPGTIPSRSCKLTCGSY